MTNSQGPRGLLRANEWALVISILLVVAGTAALDRSHSYVNYPVRSLQDNGRRLAPLGILALGAAVVIISGGIDLSLGSMAALSGTICATLLMALGGERFNSDEGAGPVVWCVAIAASLTAGLVVGTLHTWMITALRLPPFIVTLGSLVGLRSLARAFCYYMTGRFKDSSSEDLPFSDPFCDFLTERVELSLLLLAVLASGTWLILSRTVLGRHIYALGGNEQAARLSGIRTENVKWFAYTFSAVCASLTGMFYIAEAGAKPTTLANGYELNAIAAAVVGGCSLQGGIGTIPGTLLGAIFLRAVVDSVARIIKTSSDIYEGLIVGIVVVLAVTFSQLREIRQSRRQLFPGWLGILAIPCLALACGLAGLITIGSRTGLGGMLFALVVLVAWKALELRRSEVK
ncbi:MAG: ABC transporter permease [Planctomycetaceae bacterium]|nr:ABC transporter permease [Planctomycetaceae bacterium]